MILAHAGIAHTTGGGVFLAWSWDPLAVLGLGILAALYARGMLSLHPIRLRVLVWWRPVLFYTGLTFILLALISPLDALAGHLFVFHMAQHMLLINAGAPLLLLGAPVLPVLRGLPHSLRARALAPILRQRTVRLALRLLTHPLIAWSLFAAGFWVWHLPGLYSLALENEAVHIAEHATFLGTAVLFWWVVIDPVPLAGRVPYLGRFVYVILALTQGIPLAALLTFSEFPWYQPYVSGPRLWGVEPLVDQQLAGLVMWVGGMVTYFIALAALFTVALRKEEEAQVRREAAEAGA